MAKPKHILFLNSIAEHWLANDALSISCEPLIQTIGIPYNNKYLNTDIPWVFSSKTAVQQLKTDVFPQRIYAVGERTAKLLPHALRPQQATASSLAELIISEGESEVLFICGKQRREELPSLLKKSGIKVHELPVYQTEILQKDVDLKQFDGLVFMSPSAVKGMSLNGGFNKLPCFAIGPTTAQALTELKQKTICSPKSEVETLIQTAQQYFEEQTK